MSGEPSDPQPERLQAAARVSGEELDIASLDASDGFNVQEQENPDGTTALALYHHAEKSNKRIFLIAVTPPNSSTDEHGKLRRLIPVWQAIARFLNTGGDLSQLSEHIYHVNTTLNLPKPVWEEAGWHLIDTIQEVKEAQHIFVRAGTSRAAVWTEGQFVEETTIDGINSELRDREEADG